MSAVQALIDELNMTLVFPAVTCERIGNAIQALIDERLEAKAALFRARAEIERLGQPP